MQQQTVNTPSSFLKGLLGAVLGALLGAIPWFLVSTFLEFYVGWLGFIVGFAAFFGYKLLKGARVKWYGITVMILLSTVAIYISEFFSYVYVFANDPEWIQYAALEGMDVVPYVILSLIMPENLLLLLQDTAVGIIIGILGVCSNIKAINQYCSPKAENPPVMPEDVNAPFDSPADAATEQGVTMLNGEEMDHND